MARRVGANRRTKASEGRRAVNAGMRKHGLRVLAGAVVLGVVCTALVWGGQTVRGWMMSSKALAVQAIEISGAIRLDTADVISRSGIKAGMSLFAVNPEKVVAALRANPLVERVKVKRSLGRVSLEVVEREAVAVVNVGSVYQVDREGVLFDMPRGSYVRLPVISGLRDTLGSDGLRRLTRASQRRLARLRDELDESDTAWLNHLAQADFSGHERVLMRLDGYPATIAVPTGDVRRRMDHLRQLLEVLAGGTGPAARAIDLCNSSLAYVRLDDNDAREPRGSGRGE